MDGGLDGGLDGEVALPDGMKRGHRLMEAAKMKRGGSMKREPCLLRMLEVAMVVWWIEN